MRGEKGKVICVWSPLLHGEGCTTLACSLGFGLHLLSGGKVLIVNKSNSIASMERFVEKDIKIKYSMDNLRIFNEGIRSKHIITYATQINSGLHMLAGSRHSREITGVGTGFDRLFLEGCAEEFELTIVDLGTGTSPDNRVYLEYADSIIAVVTPNEIVIDELFNSSDLQNARGFFTDKKAVVVVNKLCSGWKASSVTGRYKEMLSLDGVYGMNYDGDLLNSCCIERRMYSFFMNKFNSSKSEYIQQLKQLCGFVADKLEIGGIDNEAVLPGSLFSMFRRISLY